MKFHQQHIVLLILCGLVFSCIPVVAQKKKKQQEDEAIALPSIKLREAEFYFVEGEKYFILEDYAKALVYYQKALEINPSNATIHYKVAEVLAISDKQEDLQKAAVSIEEALKLERKNKYFYLLGAGIYSSLTRFDKAAQLYETMLKEVKGTETYLYELAAMHQYAGNAEDAISAYNRAENVFGINEIASLQKQRIYFEQGKTENAFQEGEKLLNAFPDDEGFAVELAETVSQFGYKDRAIGYLEKFMRENTVAPSASVLLAGLYRDTNQEEKARNLILSIFNDEEVELTSKLIVLNTYAAELNQSKGKPDEAKEKFARELFTRLEQQYPQEPNVQVLGGDLFLSIGKEDESIRHYLHAIELGVTSFDVWQNLLYLESKLNRFDQVVKHAEQALEYFPNQAMVYYFSGIGNLRLKKNREAIYALEQAKKLSASNPGLVSEINGMLGDAFNATKEFEKSDRAYEEALAINPNNHSVLNNYSYYLALRKFNLEKAEKMAALLIKNNPDNSTYLDTYAWVLYTREKYKEARKVMEKVISIGMINATHLEHYGDILFKLGEVDLAVQQWEKAKTLLPTNNELLNKKIANRKLNE